MLLFATVSHFLHWLNIPMENTFGQCVQLTEMKDYFDAILYLRNGRVLSFFFIFQSKHRGQKWTVSQSGCLSSSTLFPSLLLCYWVNINIKSAASKWCWSNLLVYAHLNILMTLCFLKNNFNQEGIGTFWMNVTRKRQGGGGARQG